MNGHRFGAIASLSCPVALALLVMPGCSGRESCGTAQDSTRTLNDQGSSPAARATAARCLGEPSTGVDEAMSTALAQSLTDANPDVRAAAAASLGQIRERLGTLEAPYALTTKALVTALRSDDAQTRAAASALMVFGNRDALEALNDAALDTTNAPQTRADAAAMLVRIAQRRAAAVPGLRYALREHPRPGVRLAAAKALGAIRSDAIEAVPDLVVALEDADRSVQKEAARALGAVAGGTQGPNAEKAGAAVLAYVQEHWTENDAPFVAADAFGAMGDAGVPYVRQLLESDNWLLRKYGLDAVMRGAVGEFGKPSLSEASKATLQRPIRRIAADPLPPTDPQLLYARDARGAACRYLKAFDPTGFRETCAQ